MNAQSIRNNRPRSAIIPALLVILASGFAHAQVPVDEDGNPIEYAEEFATDENPATTSDATLGATELEELVGPIALYPDDLLAIVLPASTYPLEIVQAARFLELIENDDSLEPDEDWDESVVALLNYPDVVNMMNDDIDWTWRLGDAVLSQQAAVIAAVEAFRDRAYAAGNLKSDDRQVVTVDDGVIEIEPVDDEIIYVPYYEPSEVVVYQPRPVYYYYPDPYPVYYYPYPAGYHFRSRYFWGVTTAFSIGWSNHYLNVFHPTYYGHPYYGYNYFGHYYRRPSINIYNSWYVNNNRRATYNRYRYGDYWRPRTRAGSRQLEPRVRNYHYPPGGNQRHREQSLTRNSLDRRENGRMNLNLRERSAADRARAGNGSRVSGNRQSRSTAGSAGNRRNAFDRSSRSTTSANGSRRTTTRQATRGTNQPRSNVAANTRTRGDDGRAPVRFRDRSNSSGTVAPASRQTANRRNNQGTNTRSSNRQNVAASRSAPNSRSRSSATGRNQVFAAPRSTTPAARPSNRATTQRNNRATVQRQSPTVRATAPRASRPTVQQRSSAPRASAPTRRSAPRVTAPSRSQPSRSAAPSRRAAPAPSRSTNRGTSSAPRSSSGSRRSSSGRSSRPRN